MATTLYVHFPDISGDGGTYTAFLRTYSGTLVNSGGDVLAESGSTGLFSFSVAESINALGYYLVRIYSGTTETAANLVYDDILYPAQIYVGREIPPPIIFGVVGAATTPSTTQFTPSSISVNGDIANKWNGRVLLFENDTTTAGLRGQGTLITACSAATYPLFTYTALTTAPASGDTFKIL